MGVGGDYMEIFLMVSFPGSFSRGEGFPCHTHLFTIDNSVVLSVGECQKCRNYFYLNYEHLSGHQHQHQD